MGSKTEAHSALLPKQPQKTSVGNSTTCKHYPSAQPSCFQDGLLLPSFVFMWRSEPGGLCLGVGDGYVATFESVY